MTSTSYGTGLVDSLVDPIVGTIITKVVVYVCVFTFIHVPGYQYIITYMFPKILQITDYRTSNTTRSGVQYRFSST